jgi:hypothetical protein
MGRCLKSALKNAVRHRVWVKLVWVVLLARGGGTEPVFRALHPDSYRGETACALQQTRDSGGLIQFDSNCYASRT